MTICQKFSINPRMSKEGKHYEPVFHLFLYYLQNLSGYCFLWGDFSFTFLFIDLSNIFFFFSLKALTFFLLSLSLSLFCYVLSTYSYHHFVKEIACELYPPFTYIVPYFWYNLKKISFSLFLSRIHAIESQQCCLRKRKIYFLVQNIFFL